MQSSSLFAVHTALVFTLACSGSTRSEGAAAGGAVNVSGASASGGMLAAGGSGGSVGNPSDDLTSVPAGLSNSLIAGDVVGGLTLIAFTLIQGAAGPELYSAVRNDGQTPACEAGMTTYFLDQSGQVVTTVGSVFDTGRFYRESGGALIRCIDPGQIAMAGTVGLPAEIVIAELGSLQHAFPAFAVDDLVPVAALTVGGVQVVETAAGSAYTGTVTSALDTSASDPSVAIFPLNRVGRPLGRVAASSTSDLPVGGSWMFQTSTVNDTGADYAAYPSFSY